MKLTVVVEIEQDRKQNRKRYRNEDIANAYLPKVNEPATVRCWKERFADRQLFQLDATHLADVNEASEEYHGKRCGIVFNELANDPVEQTAVTDDAANVGNPEYEERYRN